MQPIMIKSPYELLSEVELINIVNLIALCNETKDFLKLLKNYNFNAINHSNVINSFFLFKLFLINEKALNNFNKKKYKLAINKRINEISISFNKNEDCFIEDEKKFLKKIIDCYDVLIIMDM